MGKARMLFLLDEDLLHCKICNGILENCRTCEEGHTLCHLCAEIMECPYCKKQFVIQNRDLDDLLKSLMVNCINEKSGCDEIVFYQEKKKHEFFCRFGKKKCPIPSCHFTGEEIDLNDHLVLSHSPKFFSIGELYKHEIYPKKPTLEVMSDFVTKECFIFFHKDTRIGVSIPLGTRHLNYQILIKGEVKWEGKVKSFHPDSQETEDGMIVEWKDGENRQEIGLMIQEDHVEDEELGIL